MHPTGNLRAVVRRGDFRRLLTVRLTSQVADGVFQASLAGSVFFNPDRQADPMAIALGFAVLILPYSVVGPFAGVLLDRVRRRNVLVVANVVRAAGIPVVAALVWAGDESWPFFLTALAMLGVNRFLLAGLSASLPHVAEPDRLITANALSTTAGTVVTALGSGLAVGLLALVGSGNHGYAVVAALSVAGYLVSAAVARGFASDQLGPDAAERSRRATAADVVRGMAAGARHLAQRRGAGYALLALTAHRVLFGLSTISMLLLYRNHFTDGPVFKAGLAGLGQVVAAAALGALAGAAVTPWVTRHLPPRTWVTALLLAAGVVELAFGMPYVQPTIMAAAFGLGLVGQGIKIVTDTAVQTECDDHFQGRVFSFYDTLFNVALVAGLLIGAVTLPATGKSYAVLGVAAVAYAATGLAYAWAAAHWHRRQGFLATGHPEPARQVDVSAA
jgi:MFS family permease